jgi:hypothetical protein
LKGMGLRDALKVALLVILILNLISSFFVTVVNPEAYFFGNKLGGTLATAYLLANGFAGMIVAYALYRFEGWGQYASVVFFGYNFTEVLFTNMRAFGRLEVSPLHAIGLLISMLMFIVNHSDRRMDHPEGISKGPWRPSMEP